VSNYERLVAEALRAPVVGWNFDWLRGRATEERPTWEYSRRARSALAAASTAMDIDTGGGEVLAYIDRFPPLMVATEAWKPNVGVAKERLRPLGVHVVETDGTPRLPFRSETFDLVLNRHGLRGRADSAEAEVWWKEVARVLRPGGALLTQQVGGRGMQSLGEAMGVVPRASRLQFDATKARRVIERSGFVVTDAREEFLRTVFFDVGAVVYYLRLVIWIVPGFSTVSHEVQLRRLHDRIQVEGPFVSHSHRILVEAHRNPSHRSSAASREAV